MALIPIVRETRIPAADHSSVASLPEEQATSSQFVQRQVAEAQRPTTFLGPADRIPIDLAVFSNLTVQAAQPQTIRTRKRRNPGARESRIPSRTSVVFLNSNQPRRSIESEGVTAASPLRYGTKAMRISMNIDPSYLEEIRAEMFSRNSGQAKFRTQHLNAWLNIPDIVLLVNPVDLSYSMANTVQETRTRGGFLQEFWGSEMDSMTANGKTATAFVARDDANDQSGGLTIRELRSSAGYNNLRRLVDIYRSNGVIYGMRAMGNYAVGFDPEKPVFRKTLLYNGFVSIFYDGVTYNGYFESFEVTESGESPFWLEWNFTFKVESQTGRDLLVYDSGKFLDESREGTATFSSRATNTTGQRNT